MVQLIKMKNLIQFWWWPEVVSTVADLNGGIDGIHSAQLPLFLEIQQTSSNHGVMDLLAGGGAWSTPMAY